MLRRDKQGTNTSSGWFVWVQKYSDPGPVEKKDFYQIQWHEITKRFVQQYVSFEV